jgi:amino acid adenylation domain-containing protein
VTLTFERDGSTSREITAAAAEYTADRDFWLHKLAGELQKSHFPYDRPPLEQERLFQTLGINLDPDLVSRLLRLGNRSEVRLYMILLAGMMLLLSRYGSSSDIVVGSPVPRVSGEGEYLNRAVALRAWCDSRLTFKEWLLRVKETVVEAGEHQNYPLETLLYKLGLRASASDFPLFDVAVLLENIHDPRLLDRLPLNLTAAFCLEGEGLAGRLDYNGRRYHKDTVRRIAAHFESLMQGCLADVDRPLADIEMLSPTQKRQLLCDFNDTAAPFPADKTIQQLFREQSARTAAAVAASEENEHLSYGRLFDQAQQLAGTLQQCGLRPNAIVAVMARRSLEVLTAIMGVLEAGAAYLPVEADYPEEHIRYVLRDSGAAVLVTMPEIPVRMEEDSFTVVTLFPGKGAGTPPPADTVESGPLDLAYCIYTSGSTGKPRGVLIRHRSAVNYLWWAARQYVRDEAVNFPLFTSCAFDLTVTSIFTPLLTGNAVVVYGEGGWVIERIVAEKRVGVVKLTPSHLKLIRHKRETGVPGIRCFIVGGEELDSRLARDIYENFNGRVEIYNEYGPTEAAVGCMIYRYTPQGQPEESGSVPIGTGAANVQLLVLDRDRHPTPFGVDGELFIAGEGLARGYLNHPELTADKFLNAAAKAREGTRSSPHQSLNPKSQILYRTGDLCRWLPGGDMLFAGRLDGQIKIRGYRVEPGEIEALLIDHPAVAEAVVTARPDPAGERQLTAYVVAPGQCQLEEELRVHLQERLPEYMVPLFFVCLPEIPLTVNGKVDYRALPAPRPGRGETFAAPRTQLEKRLADIWAGVLEIDRDEIGIDHNFFKLGGHSLKVAILMARLHQGLDVRISMVELFELPTIRQLAAVVQAARRQEFVSIEAVEKRDYYELSSPQKRLFVLQQIDRPGIGYNITSAYVVEGCLERERLEQIFDHLIRRHESFRTAFVMAGERPVQRIYRSVPFAVEYEACIGGEEEIGPAIRDFIRPFDLARPPLLRVGMIKVKGGERSLLLLDMHHIVSDGTSHGIFIDDFMALYRGDTLPLLRIQYKDYSLWLGRQEQAVMIESQQAYWLEEYEGEIPLLNLPFDYPRPEIQAFSGAIMSFTIDEKQTSGLKELADRSRATLFMTVLALFNLLLSRLSGQQDIVVGIPVAARAHVDLEPLIGMFVNTLALRSRPDPDMGFIDFLAAVREKSLAAFENQAYPFETLVEKVAVDRDTGRNPLFDVMFALQNMPLPERRLPGLALIPYAFEYGTAKFDLNLDGVEAEGCLELTLEYSTVLFKPGTAGHFIAYFKQSVTAVLESPETAMKYLDILPQAERSRLLTLCRGTDEALDPALTIQGLFEQQAARGGDRSALVWTGGNTGDPAALTYADLNRRADNLARLLRSKGSGPDRLVGLLAERSLEMIVAILSILKSGAACLPLDPQYPRPRQRYMLTDSGAQLVLAHCPGTGLEPDGLPGIEIVGIGTEDREGQGGGASVPVLSAAGCHLLYLIYTSGSTGRPKGVMLTQQNLVNLLLFQCRHTVIDCSRVLQFATICFDVSFQEIFSTLLCGGTLFLIHRQTRTDLPRLFRLIERHLIVSLFLPVSFLRLAFGDDTFSRLFPTCVNHIVSAGEQLTVLPGLRHYLQHHRVSLHNHYGPSESHVVTTLTLDPHDDIPSRPTIGRPIQNTGIYIVNRALRLQPPGSVGHLLIGGLQLGRGYLNNPELTAQKFVNINAAAKAREGTRSPKNEILTPKSQPLYKTGDLGRWCPDGSLEFLGRLDDQVKIRGFRVEPGEIENRLMQHEAIKEAVVIVRHSPKADPYLTAYIVPSNRTNKTSPAKLSQYLAESLPDYMIPAFFIQLPQIPLTPNCKVDRRALPEPEPGEAVPEPAAPTSEVERRLCRIWADILDIAPETIGLDAGFFELGGHSLKAIMLSARVERLFSTPLPMVQIFKTPTIRGLSAYIEAASGKKFSAIACSEAKEYYPLSPAQQRFYILHQVQAVGESYNMPTVVVLKGSLNGPQLEEIFSSLIRRHESLRTSFELVAGEPVQRIHRSVDFNIEYLDRAKGTPEEASIRGFIRPFDLSRAPLLRVGLIRLAAERHILMVDMDHIVSDGLSHQVLVEEFLRLYARQLLPPLRLRYRDFCQWQKRQLEAGEMARQEGYWLGEFASPPPLLSLPLDFPRPPVRSFDGDHVRFEIPPDRTRQLKALARSQEVTLFLLVFALYNVFLAKISGQEDITVGTVAAGRRHADLDPVIGVFINILALRSHPRASLTFDQFLSRVKQKMLEAFDNQDYQFDRLVERLAMKRDPGRNPLFDVMFVFAPRSAAVQSRPGQSGDGGLEVEDYPMSFRQAKFDLLLAGSEREDRLLFDFEYCTALFRRDTVERLAHYFREVVTAAADDENTRLGDIRLSHRLAALDVDAYDDSTSRFDF